MPNPRTLSPAPATGAHAFLDLLAETYADHDGSRAFAPLRVGPFQVAVQASARHRWCAPRAAVPPQDVVAWEVFITDAAGRAVGPRTHPWLFQRRPWVFHWLHDEPAEEVPVGRLVPAWVVQQLIEFLGGCARPVSNSPAPPPGPRG